MKKFIALVLGVFLMFAFTACKPVNPETPVHVVKYEITAEAEKTVPHVDADGVTRTSTVKTPAVLNISYSEDRTSGTNVLNVGVPWQKQIEVSELENLTILGIRADADVKTITARLYIDGTLYAEKTDPAYCRIDYKPY